MISLQYFEIKGILEIFFFSLRTLHLTLSLNLAVNLADLSTYLNAAIKISVALCMQRKGPAQRKALTR
jgi:hypothetical protein